MTYSAEYFRSQVAELIEKMGTKAFWRNPEAPTLAAKAIATVYLDSEDREDNRIAFEFALRELAMRNIYMTLLDRKEVDSK